MMKEIGIWIIMMATIFCVCPALVRIAEALEKIANK